MKLIRHLPPRLRQIKELADIQDAIEPELRSIEVKAEQALRNRNPLYADLDGVKVWEEWLHITPDPSKNLEQRRLEIVAKLNERLPFTLLQLHGILTGVLGTDTFKIITNPGEPFLKIEIVNSERTVSIDVGYLLKRIIPAHVLWDIVYESEYAALIDFAATYLETRIIEIPINTSMETATIYHGSPYLESATIETLIQTGEENG